MTGEGFDISWMAQDGGSGVAPPGLKPKLDIKVLREQLLQEIYLQVHNLRIPILVFALFLFCSKFIPVWLFLLCLFLTGDALFPYLPSRVKTRINEFQSKHCLDSRMLRGLKEGALALKPFFMTSLFFAAAPVAVIWMFGHYVSRIFKRERKQAAAVRRANNAVVFKQNVAKEKDEETNFFHSRAFAVTLIGIVGLGMPVAVIVLLYTALGIDQVLNRTIMHPFTNSVYYYSPNTNPYEVGPRPSLSHINTKLQGKTRRLKLSSGPLPKVRLYEPNENQPIGLCHFAAYAYLMSLGWCLSVLFMRAWITFPLNFYSTEYDIEVDFEGIRKSPIKGWFAECVWYFWPSFTASSYSWSQIKRVDYFQGGFGRLSPLPATLFSKESIVYKCLNRMAMATDACIDRIGRCEYISLDSSAEQTMSASRININLWELNSDDKARLFYAIRTYAPHLYINETVQEKLIGSKVLKEPRYTELWFDMLTSEQLRKRQDSLSCGDTLCGGKYTIVDKVGAGGQAAVFLAKTETGEEVVLKEFILTTADTFGALVESATDFENESSILSRLNHSSVVKFIDIFAEDKRAYIVLEHVSGTTLRREIVESGRLTEKEAVERAIRMCDILQYLHAQSPPVVHRDFTPENLIRQENGTLKVVDFSVASRTGPHKSGDCVGKHSYTPPEQFRSQASPQSDIYALGATLYFLVTGKDPKPITMSDPRGENANISEAFASIVMKATALEVCDRYESVDWLRLELDELRTSLTAKTDESVSAEEPDSVLNMADYNFSDSKNDKGVVIKIPAKKSKNVLGTTRRSALKTFKKKARG